MIWRLPFVGPYRGRTDYFVKKLTSLMENLMLLVCQNETYLYREDPWSQTVVEIMDFFLKIDQYDRPAQKQNITTALPGLFLF